MRVLTLSKPTSKPTSKPLVWAALAWAAMAVALLPPAVGRDGRALTPAEMAAAFGDGGTDPCVSSKTCNYAVENGVNGCAYCDSNAARDLCCNIGTNTNCAYTGGVVCDGKDLYFGLASGPAGTCGSCTALSYQKNGKCTGIKDAQGKKC
jgi:hypothetical protein